VGARRSVVAGVAGVVVALALVWGVVLVASSGDVEVRLGDDVFRAGRVERLAGAVERDGPIAIPDASPDRRRDIYLQHLGGSDDEGWVAFAAQAPGADRSCFLSWDPDDEELVDPCDGRRYPADGEGLTRYPTQVEDGLLTVDLRRPLLP
jgi:hypothetical protein